MAPRHLKKNKKTCGLLRAHAPRLVVFGACNPMSRPVHTSLDLGLDGRPQVHAEATAASLAIGSLGVALTTCILGLGLNLTAFVIGARAMRPNHAPMGVPFLGYLMSSGKHHGEYQACMGVPSMYGKHR